MTDFRDVKVGDRVFAVPPYSGSVAEYREVTQVGREYFNIKSSKFKRLDGSHVINGLKTQLWRSEEDYAEHLRQRKVRQSLDTFIRQTLSRVEFEKLEQVAAILGYQAEV